jgi:xylulokinase
MTEALLSIDVGTSSLKAVLYDVDGNVLAKESRGYWFSSPYPGWAEQDPRVWWDACCQVCRKIATVDLTHIRALAVSGQAPSCVPVNRQGEPVRPAILWLDRRADAQAKRLAQEYGEQIRRSSVMNTLDSYFGGVKWFWLQQNEPEKYDLAWKILQANSYLIYHLTGQAVTDPGHAGICSPCLNENGLEWSQEICALLGIDTDRLPEILPATQVIGKVTPAAAQVTGLLAGTPVVCGTPDFLCSFLGSAALEEHTASIMLGTAGNFMFLSPRQIDSRMLNTYYVDGRVLSTGGVLAGGAVSWFAQMMKMDAPHLLAELEEEAAAVPPGSDGLIFLPYLVGERSPIWDADARGVFLGLSVSHGRGHLYRALLEGVAYAFRQLQEILAENGAGIEQATAINGGSCSPLWRQIIADVLGMPLHYRPHKDGTSLGAAFLAGKGIGIFKDWKEIQTWLSPSITSAPNAAAEQVYQDGYHVFAGLYEQLKGSFHALRVMGR